MQTHRFHLPPERCRGEVLHLAGREAHHALHVLRLERGAPVSVLDGVGAELVCRVTDCKRDTLTLTVMEKRFTPPPRCRITLCQALPKGKMMETIVQKAVELGARRIVPLRTERVVPHVEDEAGGRKLEKWRQVAIEAGKQCGAVWLPQIEAPTTIERFLGRNEKVELALAGSLHPDCRHPREILREYEAEHGRWPETVSVWIGPEGDFTPAELQAIQVSGAHPVTFGALTLRVETAAIYGLAILNYELNQPQSG